MQAPFAMWYSLQLKDAIFFNSFFLFYFFSGAAIFSTPQMDEEKLKILAYFASNLLSVYPQLGLHLHLCI